MVDKLLGESEDIFRAEVRRQTRNEPDDLVVLGRMVVSWLFLLQGAVVEKLGLVVSYETKNLGVLFSRVRGVIDDTIIFSLSGKKLMIPSFFLYLEKIDDTIIFSLSGKKLKSFF
jgi:hypothetical protein